MKKVTGRGLIGRLAANLFQGFESLELCYRAELDFAPRYCLDAVNDHFVAPEITEQNQRLLRHLDTTWADSSKTGRSSVVLNQAGWCTRERCQYRLQTLRLLLEPLKTPNEETSWIPVVRVICH